MTTSPDQIYMLDTNVFNHVLDGKIPQTSLAGYRLCVTGIQAAELRATKRTERRESLVALFKEIAPASLPASSFAFGVEGAGFGEASWIDGSGAYERMLARLQALERRTTKRGGGQVRDILIAETAIKNGAVLITGDQNLRQVVREFGGRAISLNDLQSA